MSDYTKTTNFAVKDTLSSGDPNKVVKGTEIDSEFDALETAVNSKFDDNVSATDKLLGRSSSGAGEVEEITCTSFIRTLLDDTDAATARSTLGTAIGTDVQAHGAALDDIAAITPTDGNYIRGDGTNFVAAGAATIKNDLGLSDIVDVHAIFSHVSSGGSIRSVGSASPSCSKTGTGEYQISGLGGTGLALFGAVASKHSSGTGDQGTIHVYNNTSFDYIIVRTFDSGGSPADDDFDIIIFLYGFSG